MLCLPLCVYPLTFRIAWTTSCWSRMPSSLSEMGSTLPRSNSQRLLQQRVRCDCAATHHHTSRQRLSELHILLWAISCSFPLPTLRMRAFLLSHTFTHSLHSTTPLHHSTPLHSTPLTRSPTCALISRRLFHLAHAPPLPTQDQEQRGAGAAG